MAAAWLLTLVAVAGAWAGSHLLGSAKFPEYLAAGGGGLLLGISIFWLTPEIAETWGSLFAVLTVLAVAGILTGFDQLVSHGHRVREEGVWALLAATAVHSFLDGWSVRVMSGGAFTGIVAPAGLALHKLPEGAAVSWVMRQRLKSPAQALAATTGAEVFTLFGALAEPALNASGSARFGPWWPAAVLALIGGGFVFLGFHALLPHRNRLEVMAVFGATLLLVAALKLTQ